MGEIISLLLDWLLCEDTEQPRRRSRENRTKSPTSENRINPYNLPYESHKRLFDD